MVSPTGAVPPAGISTAAKKPPWKASTSMSALSDSTTSTESPLSTRWPGCLSHSTILPSVMVEDRAGMKMSWVANGGLRLICAAFYEAHQPQQQPQQPKAAFSQA